MIKYARFFCLFLFFISLTSYGQNVNTDSLKSVVEVAEEDTTKVETLISLSLSLVMTEPEQALDYAMQAKDLADTLNFNKGQANSLKYIGICYYYQGDYLNTINYWQQSLNVFEEIGDKAGVANLQSNMGTVYNNQGDDTKALGLYLQSLKASEEIGDSLRIATALMNIGLVYSKNDNTYDKALEYYSRALPISEGLKDKDAIGTTCLNIGEVYYFKEDYALALEYFKRSLAELEYSGNVFYSLNYIGRVYAKRGDFEDAIKIQKESYDRAKKVDAKLDMVRALLALADTYVLRKDYNTALDVLGEAKQLTIEVGSIREEKESYEKLVQSYENLGDYKNAFFSQKELTRTKDTLNIIANERNLGRLQLNYDIDKKQGEIELLTKDRELQRLTIQKQKLFKNAFLAGGLLLLIIAFIILRNYLAKVKINKLLDKQNEEIEGLLLNILPEEVAKELQEYGKAKPRDYKSVSVLFTDFKGFSSIAKTLNPNELVEELSAFFVGFDKIIEKYNLEKIKTIGDAYMCAGGVPSSNDSHPLDTVRAGLDMQKFMKENNIKRKAEGKVPWDLRVGIHTGPIVAGVVGEKKYAYDIWGSTVNIASRMESNGEAGKVNISETTYTLIKDYFTCHHRGKISAKNVGEIDMYFIDDQKK